MPSKATVNRRHKECRETIKAIKLYEKMFGVEWPSYEIEWSVMGFTSWDHKTVCLAADSIKDDPWTVVHELVHVRYPKLKHGKKFEGIVRSLFMKYRKELK